MATHESATGSRTDVVNSQFHPGLACSQLRIVECGLPIMKSARSSPTNSIQALVTPQDQDARLQGHIRIDPSLLACHHKIVTAKELQARAIVRTLRDHGFTAYLAGGCVRDKLLGIEPKDFDVATSARATDVQALFAHTVPVGAQFGVVLVVLEGNPFEVATFRADGAYLDGRHPVSVHFSGAREDARR